MRREWRALVLVGPLAAALTLSALPVYAFPASVPVFNQRDPRWAHLPLGTDMSDTIGSHGCVLTSVAMVQRFYGVATDPPSLNRWLVDNQGYIEDDIMLWRQAMVNSGGAVRWKWRHLGSLSPLLQTDEQDDPGQPTAAEARAALDAGSMVIAEVRLQGRQHFVVLTGYRGDAFLINDPWYGDRTTLDWRYGPYDQAVRSAHIFYPVS